MPPPTQRWICPVGDRERADRERELEVAVRLDPPERAHRRAAADRLERGDQVERRDLRAAGDRAAGQHGVEQLRERHVRRAAPPRRSRRGASRRRARARRAARASARCRARQTRERSFRSRSTIITCSAASFADSTGTPAGRVPLIGDVRMRVPRRESRSSGDAETIAQPSPASGAGSSGRSGASARASAARIAVELGAQMLHEVDLVDVALGDRRPHRLDRGGVLGLGPARAATSPIAYAPGRAPRRGARLDRVRDGGQRARLRRRRRRRAPQRVGAAVADVDARDDVVARRRTPPPRAPARARRATRARRSPARRLARRSAASRPRARGRRPAPARRPSG